MKKIIIAIIALGMSLGVKAQDETVNGNLTVTKNIFGKYIHTTDGNATSALFTYPGNQDLYLGSGKDQNGNKNDILLYNLSCNGGCNVPNIKLLADNVYTPGTFRSDNHIYGKYIHTTDGNATSALFTYPGNQDLYLGSGKDKNGNKNDILLYNLSCDGGCNVPNIKLLADNVFTPGNLAVGTSSTGPHKLAVEGSIGAREIKVLASGWSDFVFEKNYHLPTLEAVEEHIKKNGHLKDIPSAKEVSKNGIFLGEMNAKLLQKIEELTLYIIEQNKRINALEDKLNQK